MNRIYQLSYSVCIVYHAAKFYSKFKKTSLRVFLRYIFILHDKRGGKGPLLNTFHFIIDSPASSEPEKITEHLPPAVRYASIGPVKNIRMMSKDPFACAREMMRVLKAGGELFCSPITGSRATITT